MDSFPNEILLNIFIHLSQRYVVTICSTVCKNWNQAITRSSFYSTIHIYSEQQLEKIIQLIKEERKTTIDDNNNKHIGYYVKNLIFHNNRFTLYKIIDFSVFQNLQSIDGLGNDRSFAHNNFEKVYLQMNQPTTYFYYYWETSRLWIEKFNDIKNNLKSLHIYIVDFNPEQLQRLQQLQRYHQQSESIYLKPIGSIIKTSSLKIPIKMLILPTTQLTNLLKLKIDFNCYGRRRLHSFPDYMIDEHTFENIHQFCPLLESLSIEGFYMNLSDEYLNDINNKKIIAAHSLKNMEIIKGNINHPLCFQYLFTKYPHLESLFLDLMFNDIPLQQKILFQNTFLNMFPLQLPFLKKLSYTYLIEYNEVMPYYEFIKWLNQHPNQLSHLEYFFPLTATGRSRMNQIENNNNNNNNNNSNRISSSSPKQQLQFNFLSGLTSLSLSIDNVMNLAFTLLSENISTVIVSTTLKELRIEHSEKITKHIYFYDWLDMFPNLLLFKLAYNGQIIDDSNFFNDYNNDDIFNNGHIISNKLHQLIKERKQQQQQHEHNNNNLNKVDEDQVSYKLQDLEIAASYLWFKNGFDEPLKKCHRLKKLCLRSVNFISPMNHSPNDIIHLDLSHLHLEILNIGYINCSLRNNIEDLYEIGTIILYETITDSKRVIKREIYSDRFQQFTLSLKCKFIDGLAHSNI